MAEITSICAEVVVDNKAPPNDIVATKSSECSTLVEDMAEGSGKSSTEEGDEIVAPLKTPPRSRPTLSRFSSSPTDRSPLERLIDCPIPEDDVQATPCPSLSAPMTPSFKKKDLDGLSLPDVKGGKLPSQSSLEYQLTPTIRNTTTRKKFPVVSPEDTHLPVSIPFEIGTKRLGSLVSLPGRRPFSPCLEKDQEKMPKITHPHRRFQTCAGIGNGCSDSFEVPVPTAANRKCSRASSIGLLDIQSIRASIGEVSTKERQNSISEEEVAFMGQQTDVDETFGCPINEFTPTHISIIPYHNEDDDCSLDNSWCETASNYSFHSLDDRAGCRTTVKPVQDYATGTENNNKGSAFGAVRRSSEMWHPNPIRCASPLPCAPPSLLTIRPQYQPERQGSITKYGVEDDELSDIFTHGRGVRSNVSGDINLHQPIVLERDNWSFPSLHMAHQLEASTCCSDSLYTDSGSICTMDGMDGFSEPENGGTDDEWENHSITRRRRSVRRHARRMSKERRANEWLQEIQQDGSDLVAEAASSKFLTGGAVVTPVSITSAGVKKPPLHSLRRERTTIGADMSSSSTII